MKFIVTETPGSRSFEPFQPFIGCKYSFIKKVGNRFVFKWTYDLTSPIQLDKLSRDLNREIIIKVNGVFNMPTLLLGGCRYGNKNM